MRRLTTTREARLKRRRKHEFAKYLRKNQTPAEQALWAELRTLRSQGIPFRRQALVRGYIADFACLKAKLIVEVDGPIHDPGKDATRDGHLEAVGYRTIRFTNATVLSDPRAAARVVAAFAKDRLAPA